MRPEEAWQSATGEIEINVGRGTYSTWLKSARLVTYEDGQFIIGVPNGYVKEWMENRMVSQLKKILGDRMGRGVDVSFTLITQNTAGYSAQPVASLSASAPMPAQHTTPQVLAQSPVGYAGAPVSASAPLSDGLNPRYTFETFVVGSGNRMAHAAAMSVAEQPADRYNPLFLYGGSGLGKTHLLHAIGHSARQHGLTTFYVTSETFTNELIASIRTQSTEVFRNKYRYVDMLLMDDVQFIAGKESTQEEFFHTFNTLYSANKQIVVTSDRPPKMMVTLEERLRSRFEWGLMTDIAPPDLETRIAILQQKAQIRGIELAPDVIEFVAKQVQSNVRELEGALTRLLATSELTGRPITIQFARDTLVDLVGRRAHITPSQVIETISKFYNISIHELVSASRNRELVQPRQVAMYLIRQETDASLPEIGGLLGGRDHTTVIHGIERVKERLESEDQLRRDVMSVREQLYVNVTA
ncbi:MAG: chromosomal replication initiator protein DnaA [Chloroflexi bacterium]|nr:chromosomal replication initiator protein DnaA [Chloroflexota bacterium]MCL5273580.1 chromosomal replication initiator protein DnaA [Chloroflexota bacterium]